MRGRRKWPDEMSDFRDSRWWGMFFGEIIFGIISYYAGFQPFLTLVIMMGSAMAGSLYIDSKHDPVRGSQVSKTEQTEEERREVESAE